MPDDDGSAHVQRAQRADDHVRLVTRRVFVVARLVRQTKALEVDAKDGILGGDRGKDVVPRLERRAKSMEQHDDRARSGRVAEILIAEAGSVHRYVVAIRLRLGSAVYVKPIATPRG